MLLFVVAWLCEARVSRRRRCNGERDDCGKSQVGPLAEFFRKIGVKEESSRNGALPRGKKMRRKLEKEMERYTEESLKRLMKKRRNRSLRELIDLNLYGKYGLDGIMMTHGLESKASSLLPYLILRSKSKAKANGDSNRLIDALLRK